MKLGLHTKMALLSFASVLLAIVVGGGLVVERITTQIEKEMGMRALAIARTLAQMEEIQLNVGCEGGEKVIQPLAERIRTATGVAYVVILDNAGVRYSHPLEEHIGKPFSGSDYHPAVQEGEEYLSAAEGILGPSIRAFVPIKTNEGTKQVGAVVVGILTPTVHSVLQTIRIQLYFALSLSLLLGLLGSLFLARVIKKEMFDLEPDEIARLLEERHAILESIGDGIIATDKDMHITLINRVALDLTGVTPVVLGRSIEEVLPQSRLPDVVSTGQPVLNNELVVNNVVLVVNHLPVYARGRIAGVVSTFRDKTEVRRLAEELTGVKRFIEALRVRNHEYRNTLHTIAGLIQLEHYQEALDYVFTETAEQQEISSFLGKRVQDYGVAGVILGKYSRAKELKIDLTIDRNSRLTRLPQRIDTSGMVIIIGNLLENAFEAVREMEPGRQKVCIGIFEEEDLLRLVIRDQGPGIPADLRDQIFVPGFSTKDGQNHGLGLSLVKQYVQLADGDIVVNSSSEDGAEFVITIPLDGECE